ncbi:hypothetical protein R6Q59_033107 [Mikania micrantha]
MITSIVEIQSIALRIILKRLISVRSDLRLPTKPSDEVLPLRTCNQFRILLHALRSFHEPRVLIDQISGWLLVQESRRFSVVVVVEAAEEAETGGGSSGFVVGVEVFTFLIVFHDDRRQRL